MVKQNISLIITIILLYLILILLMLDDIAWFYSTLNLSELLYAALVALGVVMVYLIPSLVAFYRNKQNKGAILALNILLGFTFIGWVIALVWALTKD
jgi:Mn2+/Fe2+ NRAMP family transporter